MEAYNSVRHHPAPEKQNARNFGLDDSMMGMLAKVFTDAALSTAAEAKIIKEG